MKEKKSLPQDLIPFYALHSPPNQQLGEVGLGVLAGIPKIDKIFDENQDYKISLARLLHQVA